MKFYPDTFIAILWEGGLLSLAFLYLISLQWFWVIQGWRKKKNKSLVPLIGGMLGALMVWFSDEPDRIYYLWMPFMLDPGSGLMLLNGFYHFLMKK